MTTELAHFGVRGMKWGVRRDSDSGDSGSSKPKTGWSDDQKKKLKTVATIAAGAAVAGGLLYLGSRTGFNQQALSAIKNSPELISKGKAAAAKVLPKAMKVGMGAVQVGKVAAQVQAAKPKMDKETADFLADSARRQAADKQEHQAWAKSTVASIESDPFMLKFMKGSDPKGYADLVNTARGG